MTKTVGEALIALKNRSGLSLTAIARSAGYSGASSVQAFFHANYDPSGLDIAIAQKLSAALVGKGTPPITEEEIFDLLRVKFPIHPPEPPSGRNFLDSDVPVYETRRLIDPSFLAEPVPGLAFATADFRSPLRYYPRAAGLSWNANAYALHMVGHNMSPRFRDGEPFFVSASRSPSANDDVIMRIKHNTAHEIANTHTLITFGRFAEQDAARVAIFQYGTDRTVSVPNRLVLSLERIAPWGEVCGLPYA